MSSCRPEGVVALPAAGHRVGHTAARARVRALHNDKGPLFQRGHRQVPAVYHGLQGGAVARPHWVLHVEDAMVPAPHLQRVASLSPGPPAPSLPPSGWGLWRGSAVPARAQNFPLTPRDAWSRTEQGLEPEHLDNGRVGERSREGQKEGLPQPPPRLRSLCFLVQPLHCCQPMAPSRGLSLPHQAHFPWYIKTSPQHSRPFTLRSNLSPSPHLSSSVFTPPNTSLKNAPNPPTPLSIPG